MPDISRIINNQNREMGWLILVRSGKQWQVWQLRQIFLRDLTLACRKIIPSCPRPVLSDPIAGWLYLCPKQSLDLFPRRPFMAGYRRTERTAADPA